MKHIALLHIKRDCSNPREIIPREEHYSPCNSVALARSSLRDYYDSFFVEYERNYHYVYRATTRDNGNRLAEVTFYCYDINYHLVFTHCIKIVKDYEK